MQASEHLIAYQIFPLTDYQCLRKALIQQGHLFELVMTEQSIELPPEAFDSFSRNRQFPGHLAPGHLDNEPPNDWLAYLQMAAQRADGKLAKASAHSQRWPVSPGGARMPNSFVLMRSQTLSVLLTATPIETPINPALGQVGGRQTGDRAQTITECRVGLTFSEQAITDFLDPQAGQTASFRSGLQTPPPKQHPGNSSALNPHPSTDQKATSISSQEKRMAQESFVLSWAKQLATSPESDRPQSQDKVERQLQQSLLLEQVIARIRHSLDLPEILEATVTQVREFLRADRLVLYQFDQSNSTERSLIGSYRSAEEADISTVQLNRAGHGTARRAIHSGYVTYESRASADISSVLHSSEETCFELSQALRAQYLIGQPVAVDDIEQQYAGTPCLLDFLRQAQIKSKIIAPVIVQDQLWGLLIAHQCQNYRHWEETEAIFLQHVAEHLAVAITQASLYQQLRQQTVNLESCVVERTQNLHDALVAAESASVTKGEFLSTMS
ncbi:MAG: GAF domain-containing protein, partial [Phormidesmis sp.]